MVQNALLPSLCTEPNCSNLRGMSCMSCIQKCDEATCNLPLFHLFWNSNINSKRSYS
jgi:hypothetical protein